MPRLLVALGFAASLLIAPASASASNTNIVSISDGNVLTPDDIAQFDARWMQQSDRDGRIGDDTGQMAQRDAKIAWAIGDDAHAMVRMYELTRNPKYVDHLKKLADVTFRYRDDQYPGGGTPEFCALCDPNLIFDHERGAKEPAWASGLFTDYVNDGGLQPVDAVTSGVYLYPIAALARVVAEDPNLQVMYGPAAMAAIDEALQTFWVFEPDMDSWQGAGGIEGTIRRPVRFPTMGECNLAYLAAIKTFKQSNPTDQDLQTVTNDVGKSRNDCYAAGSKARTALAHNESSSLMLSFVELWRALDSPYYRANGSGANSAAFARALIPLYVARHQRYFVNRLQIQNDNAQGQRYWWRYNDDAGPTHTEDATHASLDITYIAVLRSAYARLNAASSANGEPLLLDDAMMRRFANSFLQQIARPTEIDAGGNFRGDFDGRTAYDIRGDPYYYNGVCDGWGTLAEVDATIWRICRSMTLRQMPPDQDGNRQPFMSIANHATLLATRSFARQLADTDLTVQTGVAPAGDAFGWSFNPHNGQDVTFRGSSGHAYQLSRIPGGQAIVNMSALTGAPGPSGEVRGFDFAALGLHNAVYRGTDGHLHWMRWANGLPFHDDLTSRSGAPAPAGDPFPYVSAPFGVQNVVYRSSNGHVHALYWSTGAVGHDDLTALSGAVPAAGDPVAYFDDAAQVQSIYYRGTDGHIHRLFCGLGAVSHQDLTALTGAPAPASELSAYVTPAGLNNVVYRGMDGDLHGLWFSGNGPVGWDDLSWAAAGAPRPGALDPSAYFFAQNGTHHVLYTTINGHLHELTWTTGAVTHTDLTTAGASTTPYGNPFGYAVPYDGSQHIVYRATDGHLHDVSWLTPRYFRFGCLNC